MVSWRKGPRSATQTCALRRSGPPIGVAVLHIYLVRVTPSFLDPLTCNYVYSEHMSLSMRGPTSD